MTANHDRTKILTGKTIRVSTGCGHLYITTNYDTNDNLVEVFATLGKAGGCAKGFLEALTRSITLGIKYGVPVDEFVKELKEIRCPILGWDEGMQVLSCPDAIAKVLEVA